MALAEIECEGALKDLAGKPFVINPSSAYERKEFASRSDKLFKLERYLNGVRQNSGDLDALKDLVSLVTGYMPGDKESRAEYESQMMSNPHLALEQGDNMLSFGYVSMAQFVQNHRSELLDKLSAKQLLEVFSRVPLYKTGDAEHDKISALRNKIVDIQQKTKEGAGLEGIVQEEIGELVDAAPPEQKPYLFKNQHLVIPALARAVVKYIQKRFNNIFKNADGQLDRDMIVKHLEDNYKVIEDFMDNDMPSGDEGDQMKAAYWDKNLKPQYVEIARALYKPEKKAQKWEDEPENQEREAKAGDTGIEVP